MLKNIAQILVCVAMFLVYLGVLTGLAAPALLMLSLGLCLLSEPYRFSHLDWVMATISCVSLIAALVSSNTVLSIINIIPIETGILIYFIIRVQRYTGALLAPLLSCNILSIAALGFFYERYQRWIALGFSDLIPFRHQVSTAIPVLHLGNPTGMYIAAPAYSLCVLYQVQKQSRPAVLGLSSLPLFVSILTFSRGAYLALAMSLILGVSTLFTLGKKSRGLLLSALCIISFISSATVSWRLGPFIVHTLLMAKTSTQLRSLHGRIEILRELFLFALHSKPFGLGPGSLIHIHSTLIPQAFNSLLQIWIQFGYVGLGAAIYGIVMLFVTIRRLATVSRSFALAILGFTAAIFVYNSFWSSLVLDERSLYFACLLPALVANAEETLSHPTILAHRCLAYSFADGHRCEASDASGVS